VAFTTLYRCGPKKLNNFQDYDNNTRAHSLHEMKMPNKMNNVSNLDKEIISLDNSHWKTQCSGLDQLPIAA